MFTGRLGRFNNCLSIKSLNFSYKQRDKSISLGSLGQSKHRNRRGKYHLLVLVGTMDPVLENRQVVVEVIERAL